MKKLTQSITAFLLAAVLIFSFPACSNKSETQPQNDSGAESQVQQAQINKTGLWENATYLADSEFGQGEKTVVVEVQADDQIATFTFHTDESTVGAALLENNFIAGDESEYGLYVKVVNGMTADYDVDQSYWAFYIDGEYATTGVDSTEIVEGAVYQLAYTK